MADFDFSAEAIAKYQRIANAAIEAAGGLDKIEALNSKLPTIPYPNAPKEPRARLTSLKIALSGLGKWSENSPVELFRGELQQMRADTPSMSPVDRPVASEEAQNWASAWLIKIFCLSANIDAFAGWSQDRALVADLRKVQEALDAAIVTEGLQKVSQEKRDGLSELLTPRKGGRGT